MGGRQLQVSAKVDHNAVKLNTINTSILQHRMKPKLVNIYKFYLCPTLLRCRESNP